MPRILITGAASGLGRAFVAEFLRRDDNKRSSDQCSTSDLTIHALDRCFPPSSRRDSLFSDPRITIHEADIRDESTIMAMIANVSSTIPRQQHQNDETPVLDTVIHSAGVRGLVPSIPVKQSSDVRSAETYHVMDTDTMRTAWEINALGTFILIKALLPLLTTSHPSPPPYAPTSSHASTANGPKSKFIIMGSRMGSMSLNVPGNPSGGAAYAYRASKAALNAIVRSFAVDVPDVTFLVVHPGRVETNIVGGAKEDGSFTVEEVMGDLMKVIEMANGSGSGRSGGGIDDVGSEAEGNEKREKTAGWSGRFVDRWGVDIPW